MTQKSFLATQTDKQIIQVLAVDELPFMLHAAFYENDYVLYLDGDYYWTPEQESVARELAAASIINVPARQKALREY